MLDLTVFVAPQSDGRVLVIFHVQSPIKQKRGDAMSNPVKTAKPDSKVDAWAILFIIILVVSTAVFWVSHQ
ncbi:MAG: hypothetical protein JWR17_4652 [Pseudomonas sp.]|jgi:hypothetical protein|uniref:hypothetical protein n=1 Tax=Pseudomonas sp. TaxID=306 RepID=UPI002619FA99|nr:hypothetical protein [Pseudomonas sp.]MDB6051906.1 hypothetical protein [Pseudomonas sp.]